MYERFTDRARKVMQLANQESFHANFKLIYPETILAGLVKEDSGVAAYILKEQGLDLQKIREHIATLPYMRDKEISLARLPLSESVEHCIVAAKEATDRLDHLYVGTEHLLIGIVGWIAPELLGENRSQAENVQYVEELVKQILKPKKPVEKDIYTPIELLDWFAGQALVGVMSNPVTRSWDANQLAEKAYEIADAMIKRSNRK